MKKSYECEVATHIGPESCGAARKGGVEALTGERGASTAARDQHPWTKERHNQYPVGARQKQTVRHSRFSIQNLRNFVLLT